MGGSLGEKVQQAMTLLDGEIQKERIRVLTWQKWTLEAVGPTKYQKHWNDVRAGKTKRLYNLQEQYHVLNLLKNAPGRQYFSQTSFVALVDKNGNVVKNLTGKGQRIADWAELGGTKSRPLVELGDVKSKWTLLKSYYKSTKDGLVDDGFKSSSDMQKQIVKEKGIIDKALKENLKIKLRMQHPLKSGVFVEVVVDPKDIKPSRVVTYEFVHNSRLQRPKISLFVLEERKARGKGDKKTSGRPKTFFDEVTRKALGKPTKAKPTLPTIFGGISTKEVRKPAKTAWRPPNPLDPEPTYARNTPIVPKSAPVPIAHQENINKIRGIPTRRGKSAKRGRVRRLGGAGLKGAGRLARGAGSGVFIIADFVWRSYWEAEAQKIRDQVSILEAETGEKEAKRIQESIRNQQKFIHRLLKKKRKDIVDLINQGKPVYAIVQLNLEFKDLDYGAMFFKYGDRPNRWEYSHISKYDVSVSDKPVPDNIRIVERKRSGWVPVDMEGILERKVTAGVKDQTLQVFTYSVKLHRGMTPQEKRLTNRMGTPVYVDTPQTPMGDWKPSAN